MTGNGSRDSLEAYIDGGSRGNPGPSGLGVYVPGLLRMSEYLGTQTNNFAEYSALIAAVQFAAARRCRALRVYSDSELVVKQIRGEYKVRNENIRPLYERALRWIRTIPDFSIEHVRREFNKDADRLANDAMDGRSNAMTWES
jgi:probable phosphoglycerate mutase